MNLLKKGIYFLLALTFIASCSSDDTTPIDNNNGGNTNAITNLDFTTNVSNNTVTVTPSADGPMIINYTIDFGATENDDTDVFTVNAFKKFTYPEENKTYTISVTAEASGETAGPVSKDVNIVFVALGDLFTFEGDPSGYSLQGDGNQVEIEVVNRADIPALANDTLNQSDKIVKMVDGPGKWNAAKMGIPGKYIDLTGNGSITIDFWQEDAISIPVLMKMEASQYGEYAVEVLAHTQAKIGWQEITFDFENNRVNSYPNGVAPLANLSAYELFAFFVNFDTTATGTYYFDNFKGGAVGDNTPQEGRAVNPAPEPQESSSDVYSLFSDSYTTQKETTISGWSNTKFFLENIDGNEAYKFSEFDYVGVLTDTLDAEKINVSDLTHLHFDYWAYELDQLGVKLVDNQAIEVPFLLGELITGSWTSVWIPLSDFPGVNLSEITQIYFAGQEGASGRLYIDNLYFCKNPAGTYSGGDGGGTVDTDPAPTEAAVAPTADAADVISIFSDAYNDHLAGTVWNPSWGQTTTDDKRTIDDSEMVKYKDLDFTGIEPSNPIDLSNMTHFNVSYWTENAGVDFGVKLVDYGANGAWDGGGDDVEHELTYTSSAGWNYLNISIDDFTGMTTREHFAQLIFIGSGIVYVDDIYFSKELLANPIAAPAAPTADAADVISIFSDSYTDIAIGSYSPEWDEAEVSDEQIASNNVKKYTDFGWAGIVVDNNYASLIDVSSMTHFNISFWSNNLSEVNIKLVDIMSGSEHELTFSNDTPAQWTNLQIPLANFTGLASLTDIGQIFMSGGTGSETIYVDDIYFSK